MWSSCCGLNGLLVFQCLIPAVRPSSEATGCREKTATSSNPETWCSPRWRASLTGRRGCAHTSAVNTCMQLFVCTRFNSSSVFYRSVSRTRGTRSESPSSFSAPIRCTYVQLQIDRIIFWAALIELWLISPPQRLPAAGEHRPLCGKQDEVWQRRSHQRLHRGHVGDPEHAWSRE